MKKNYSEDLREIRDIMQRSSRFISLSGLSGVSTGIIALIGAFLAYQIVFKDADFLVYNQVQLSRESLVNLLLIASGTLIVSIGNAIFFTKIKTQPHEQNAWDVASKKLLVNLLIPLASGGILCLLFLWKGFVGVLPSLTLIFYGLALVNGSKYTFSEIRSLGVIQIILGLLAFAFLPYSLHLWALGFGIVQILYGLVIQRKYKS
ncbi:MAG: hypothetical protein RQ735_00735 [Flavobacteriaceae bacterium]|nr:hypothetical protein [Flavobacteriaceae bacterium]